MSFGFGFAQSLVPQWELIQANICPDSPTSASDTVNSVISSLFDVASDVDDESDHTVYSSDGECDYSVLPGEHTGHSKDENLEGRINMHANVERVLGSLALADPDDEVIPARYAERDPSYYPKRIQSHYPTPIGQRPYRPWPLPDEEQRPTGNQPHGQKTITRNVVQPTTYPTRRLDDDNVFTYFEKILQEPWGGFYQARDAPRLWSIQGLPAQRGRR
ncbi:hypothetical protein QCA50_000468 [Cerrena zonata]|uniref:Uncharacterized protein n=1 Tax=Cerrena zonata TaxID=2478898 RepID=A0AAW0GZS5_9APHY